MPTPTPERIAVLVVRAWREGEEAAGARARITWVDDVADGTEQTALAATAAEVLDTVRRWLQNAWDPPPS